MRKTTIALNSIVAAFFALFLAYTFFATRHLEELARRFVTEKTLQHSKSVVALAEETLDAPLARKLLSDEQAAAIRHEIGEYRQDAAGYIADLSRQARLRPSPRPLGPLAEKIASLKERIRTFYDDTLAALIGDLRFFSTSNVCAAVVALWLACRPGRADRNSLVWFSLLLCASVLYCSYVYIDDLTFFRILFRAHMGVWYPVFLCATLAWLYREYGRIDHATDQAVPPEPNGRKAKAASTPAAGFFAGGG